MNIKIRVRKSHLSLSLNHLFTTTSNKHVQHFGTKMQDFPGGTQHFLYLIPLVMWHVALLSNKWDWKIIVLPNLSNVISLSLSLSHCVFIFFLLYTKHEDKHSQYRGGLHMFMSQTCEKREPYHGWIQILLAIRRQMFWIWNTNSKCTPHVDLKSYTYGYQR